MAPDAAVAEIAGLVRRFHDAVAGFDGHSYEWSDRGSDGGRDGEILCHNDLAAWNLVHRSGGGWAFVDWDLAAPGSRSWDVAWALLTIVPLSPDFVVPGAGVVRRLRIFREAYGPEEIGPEVIDVAAARCRREADLIRTRGAAGEAPYDRLLAEGHHAIWAGAAAHVERNAAMWKEAAFSPSPAPPGSA